MRKQRQVDELWSQVMWLRNENHQLLRKLNCVLESQEKVIEENAQLKEETSELKQMISDLQLQNQSPFSCIRDDIVQMIYLLVTLVCIFKCISRDLSQIKTINQ